MSEVKGLTPIRLRHPASTTNELHLHQHPDLKRQAPGKEWRGWRLQLIKQLWVSFLKFRRFTSFSCNCKPLTLSRSILCSCWIFLNLSLKSSFSISRSFNNKNIINQHNRAMPQEDFEGTLLSHTDVHRESSFKYKWYFFVWGLKRWLTSEVFSVLAEDLN